MDKQYAKEKAQLDQEQADLIKQIGACERNGNSARKFVTLIDKYEKFDELSNAMINEFIDKVLIHERDRKGSTQTTQEIEIYFNFVGQYIPPTFATELSEEDQTELDRINVIKDKRHERYLRRKASGWQRKYEDRIKNEKREKIEALKQKIREEDQANGVYATVGNLALESQVAEPQ